MARIESLLSARLFLAPQRVGDRVYFVSNMSGRLSLYVMKATGSVPEPLLPPELALQNPELTGGYLYYVFPELGKILLMLDHDGDESYVPHFIPIEGGYPEPVFGDRFANYRVYCVLPDSERNTACFVAASHSEPVYTSFSANLETRTLVKLQDSRYGAFPAGSNHDDSKVVLAEGYTVGDLVLFLWNQGTLAPIYGTPLEQRPAGSDVKLTGFGLAFFTTMDRGLLIMTTLFDDCGGLGYLDLANPADIRPVAITGLAHHGNGELVGMNHTIGNRYALIYNIDGCSWVYEAAYDETSLTMKVEYVICGEGMLTGGVIEGVEYDRQTDSYALAFSTATSPTQLVLVGDSDRKTVNAITQERVLAIPQDCLSKGEDASFTSYDGQRVSARLYLPAKALGFEGRRPLVYYVHGGPQGQERPNFAWFSMPLIQYLTLSGFAVFVPNVRGSTGYGLSYTKKVDHDWGGADRLDHVHAMGLLAADKRLDTSRAAVVGRSYGGYMTLTLASRHPELWSAACDMFGPANLVTFMERIPETWKPYFAIALGDPATEHDFLVERSPLTYIDQVRCPLLVIQGKNDPRVVPQESLDVVNRLKATGHTVDYLLFENEGHDVLKFENRVRCYNAIKDFFREYLKP
ncbi:MAG TPA: alpha/beta fold hydrolase [Aggregatilineales bacterium]|nr:alpha/beta fold hydrolase [Aggregatilineales bacterium]